MKRGLAEHSLNLAQGADVIGQRAEDDPVVLWDDSVRSRPVLGCELPYREKQTVERLLEQAQDAHNGHHLLRQLACWYREFAERAGDPVIWEARLRMADSLDIEAERIEGRNAHPDGDQ
jgi:hypothetical protein